MRTKLLFSVALLVAVWAPAQTINHVIFIVKENRSTDGYFGNLAGMSNYCQSTCSAGSGNAGQPCTRNSQCCVGSSTACGTSVAYCGASNSGISGQASARRCVNGTNAGASCATDSTCTGGGICEPLACVMPNDATSQCTAPDSCGYIQSAVTTTGTRATAKGVLPPTSTANNGQHDRVSTYRYMNKGLMNGWVNNSDSGIVYYANSTTIPWYYSMASAYGIADNHFSVAAGPSQPQHLYVFAATSNESSENPTLTSTGAAPPGHLAVTSSWNCGATRTGSDSPTGTGDLYKGSLTSNRASDGVQYYAGVCSNDSTKACTCACSPISVTSVVANTPTKGNATYTISYPSTGLNTNTIGWQHDVGAKVTISGFNNSANNVSGASFTSVSRTGLSFVVSNRNAVTETCPGTCSGTMPGAECNNTTASPLSCSDPPGLTVCGTGNSCSTKHSIGGTTGAPCPNVTTIADVTESAGKTWKFYSTNVSYNSAAMIRHLYFRPGAVGSCVVGGGTCGSNSDCISSGGGECTAFQAEVFPGSPSTLGGTDSPFMRDAATCATGICSLGGASCTTDGGTYGAGGCSGHGTCIAANSCRIPNIAYMVPEDETEHPGASSPQEGETWSKNTVQAVFNSPYLYNHSIIFITWDDAGGGYDHVPPPIQDNLTLGIRVPLLCIGAYCKNQVTHTQFDFTSVMKCMEDVFGLGNVSTRDAAAIDACGGSWTLSSAADGSGYQPGDVLIVEQPGASNGTVQVLSVNGAGAITNAVVLNAGSGYRIANGLTTTGGTGSGATINITSRGSLTLNMDGMVNTAQSPIPPQIN